MSAIFISHSSADSEAASELRARLEEQGHRSVFLDFDPADGIPAGRDWERELYQQLKACQAVIVLCSADSMASQWCLIEIGIAKSLGTHLFPVKIGECDVSGLLTSAQVVDLTTDAEGGYARLWHGLVKAGLDPKDAFDWDGSRPPYPGLLAFQEQDAAIYFGRDEEIREGLSQLNQLWQYGGETGLIVLGPSGTGKSSLVRAGLLPRLRRDGDRWLVVGPFRPGSRPWQSLAMALSQTFQAHGSPRDWRVLRDELETSSRTCLLETGHDLTHAAGRTESRVLLVMDQMEELLGSDEGATPFLPGFVEGLSEGQSLFLGTLRSDFLGALQQDPGGRDLRFKDLRIGPLPKDRIGQVIEGPAARAGLELEPGLTQTMVADCERGDALPLLAFTLRELYEQWGDDQKLELREYGALGGLGGAVAHAADRAFQDAPEEVARPAFLSMVRVNDDGLFVRRAVRWSDLSQEAVPIIERFVEARLLMAGEVDRRRIVEVAHEALIRRWDRLNRWVSEDSEFFKWQQRLAHYLTEWQSGGRDRGALLRGGVLDEAMRWLDERGEAMDAGARAFVETSLRAPLEEIDTSPALPEGWSDLLSDMELTNRQLADVAHALEDMAARGLVDAPRAHRLRQDVRAAFIAQRPAPPTNEEDAQLNRRLLIEGGAFPMGGGSQPESLPIHMVTLPSFWIQEHPVTNDEYRRFDPKHRSGTERGRHPVTVVWYDAMAYAVWLGGTLPTEAQWEFTARGREGRTYPWGEGEPTQKRAHFAGGSPASTIAVMGRPEGATPAGVHDLAGNVWEWVADWYAAYPPGDVANPRGPTRGTWRVARGGSFRAFSRNLSGWDRHRLEPGIGSGFDGFRVAWPGGQ